MTCDKCGKELEVIKTDTGGAFLPCGCEIQKQSGNVVFYINSEIEKRVSQWIDEAEGFDFRKNYIDALTANAKLEAALNIAIDRLTVISKIDESAGVKAMHARLCLDKINEVCK